MKIRKRKFQRKFLGSGKILDDSSNQFSKEEADDLPF